MQFLQRPVEGVRFPPGSGVLEGREQSGYWELNPSLLQPILNCGATPPPLLLTDKV